MEAATPDGLRAKRRRRQLWLILPLTIMLVIIILIYMWATSPAQGVIKSAQLEESTAKAAASDKQYNGKYFALAYPQTLRQITPQPDSVTLEALLAVGMAGSSRRLAVTARMINVNEDPSVQSRRQDRNKYAELKLTRGNDPAVLFTMVGGGWEKTIFIQHGGLEVVVALTDPNGNDHSDEFERIVASLVVRP